MFGSMQTYKDCLGNCSCGFLMDRFWGLVSKGNQTKITRFSGLHTWSQMPVSPVPHFRGIKCPLQYYSCKTKKSCLGCLMQKPYKQGRRERGRRAIYEWSFKKGSLPTPRVPLFVYPQTKTQAPLFGETGVGRSRKSKI